MGMTHLSICSGRHATVLICTLGSKSLHIFSRESLDWANFSKPVMSNLLPLCCTQITRWTVWTLHQIVTWQIGPSMRVKETCLMSHPVSPCIEPRLVQLRRWSWLQFELYSVQTAYANNFLLFSLSLVLWFPFPCPSGFPGWWLQPGGGQKRGTLQTVISILSPSPGGVWSGWWGYLPPPSWVPFALFLLVNALLLFFFYWCVSSSELTTHDVFCL